MKMLNVVRGNLFETEKEVIVNANNSIGIMGGGIAKAFIIRYPDACNAYNSLQKMLQSKYESPILLKPSLYKKEDWHLDKHIMMFPTMIYPGEVAKKSNIEKNLNVSFDLLRKEGIKSVAFPAIGCGIGRLPFEDLKLMFNDYSEEFDIELYEPM